MRTIVRSALAAVALATLPLSFALAQNPGPVTTPEAGKGQVAVPTYPPGGHDVDPALTGVAPTAEMGRAPPSGDPNVAGATGETVIPGDLSSIRGDKAAIVDQKTGQLGGN